jgi:hypothetical protein
VTRRPCPACRGTGLQHIRAGCAYVRCYICKGKGAILLSSPPAPSGVPSSGGNRPPEGGEKQIKSWIAPLVVVLALSLGCTFDLSQLRALPGGDAGADLVPVADLVRALVPDALPALAPDAQPVLVADAQPVLVADAQPALAPDAQPVLVADAQPVLVTDAQPVYGDCQLKGVSYNSTMCPNLAYRCLQVQGLEKGGLSVGPLSPDPCRYVLSPANEWIVSTCRLCPKVAP